MAQGGGGAREGGAPAALSQAVASIVERVEGEASARAYRVANELRNASLFVLRGRRGGREYRVPAARRAYRASAPGEPPAVRTGAFRLSWGARAHVEKAGGRLLAVSSAASGIQAGARPLGDLLEEGSERMAPRPYKEAVKARALPAARAIYGRPYGL